MCPHLKHPRNIWIFFGLVHILLVTRNQDGDSNLLDKLLSNSWPCYCHFGSTFISLIGNNLSATLTWVVISYYMGFLAYYKCTSLPYVYMQVDLPRNQGGNLLSM